MRSHFSLNRGVATACAVAGATTLLNGHCSAQNLIAADYATNSAYAGGWSAGQNGGYGWGAWSMANTGGSSPSNSVMNNLDTTSPYNPFGVAWALYDLQGTTPAPSSPGTRCTNPPLGTDISRAGRAIPGGLKIGQTFSTVVANPDTRTFFRGYTIVLSTGSDNIAYGASGQQITAGCFEYFSYGNWVATLGPGMGQSTSLFDIDTTTNGVQVDITLTSTNTFHMVMTPLGNPANAWTGDGALENKGLTDQGQINWVTYQLYNTDSNFHPTLAPCGPDRTDFYIKSMTISGLALNVQQAGSNIVLSWSTNTPGFTLVSTPQLGAGAVWSPVSPAPVVVNNLNVVTNPIVGSQQFYRLQQ